MSLRCAPRQTLCLTKGLPLTRHCIATTTTSAVASVTLSLISLPQRANFTIAPTSGACTYDQTRSPNSFRGINRYRSRPSRYLQTIRHSAVYHTLYRGTYTVPDARFGILRRPSRSLNKFPIMSSTMTQTRTHIGHGHHHHHDHDTTFLISTNKNDAGVRITKIGLYVNLAMAIGKGVGGYVFHSQALSADAVHSATDLVSDFMTLATVSLALRPPTNQYPLGFGKIESLGSLGVSGLLLIGGLWMGWSSLLDLTMIYFPSWAHALEMLGMIGCSHGHNHSHSIPNIQAAWLAGGSVLVKEWLYRATMKVAVERKSAVLKSNAVHHRVDSLTGIAALFSIAISNIFPTFAGMDAVGGLLISYMIIRAGWGNTVTSLQELADATVSDDVKEKTKTIANRAVQDCNLAGSLVKAVSGTKAGQNYLLDITVAVLPNTDLQELTSVEQIIRERVASNVRGARRVRIRFVPAGNAYDPMDEFVTSRDSATSTPESQDLVHPVHGQGHTTGATNGNSMNGSPTKRR